MVYERCFSPHDAHRPKSMRIVLTSFGSTGDYEPFLALAVELQRHGHQPVLACVPEYRERAERFGIEFVPTGPPSLIEAVQDGIRADLETNESPCRRFEPFTPAAMIRMFNDLSRACRAADLLICSAQWPFGRMIHELTGIPFVSIQLEAFDDRFASENRERLAAWEAQFADAINPFRVRMGLPPLQALLGADGDSPQLALYAVSRLLLDPARVPGWPAHRHVTGFFFPEASADAIDPALREFVEGGAPPVVISFGSMVQDDPSLAETLVQTALGLDRPTVIVQGWSLLANDVPPAAKVRIVKYIPYDWLFSRAACVVHACGAGITSLALRAGLPGVLVPHLYHQFGFAKFAASAGCGVILPRPEMNADSLTDAIRKVLGTPSYRAAATAAGAHLRAEGGVRTAREWIERWAIDCPDLHRKQKRAGR